MPILHDGFSTTVQLFTTNLILNVVVQEKSVNPPDMSAGGPIHTENMRSLIWRTRDPKKLVSLGKMTLRVVYDPISYVAVSAALGVNQICGITFPDGQQLRFWAFVDEFKPGDNKEGEEPIADLTIEPTLHDLVGNTVAPFML